MRHWDLAVELDRERSQPLFLQLADAIAGDIRSGRLHPGDALPGTRELARRLALNRNTIVAAYEELAAQGCVSARVGGGTFVEAPSAAARAPLTPRAATPTYALPSAAPVPRAPAADAGRLLRLAGGLPDPRLFPSRAFACAFRRAIERRSHDPFGAGDARGQLRLREALATMLSQSRGVAATSANVMVTRSVEHAIDLAARCLIAPGDVVAVEALGYPPAWNALRLAGARLRPVAVDAHGLDVDALAALLAHTPLRAVFLTPHHQFPTTAVMPAARRARLGALALRHRFAIIEDDYDHEYHYEGKPLRPLAAGAAGANVVYVGSLANLLAPGVGTGYVVAPAPVAARLHALREASDPRCDAALECALAELFEDGEMVRHVRRTRRAYASRRDALADALRRHLGGVLAFDVPAGGLALWARVDADVDIDAWIAESARAGVQLQSARAYALKGADPRALRIGFGYHDEHELGDAVARLSRALVRTRVAVPGMPAHDIARSVPSHTARNHRPDQRRSA